jgi:hypothetical protein
MRPRTPPEEVRFAEAVIAPYIKRLKASSADLEAFIAYAVRNGADQISVTTRLKKLLAGGRPTTYLVALLVAWGGQPDRPQA